MPLFRTAVTFSRFIPIVFFNLKNPMAYISSFFRSKSTVARFYNGLLVPANTPFSFGFVNAIYFQKIYGRTEKNWKTVVDVGANRGYFSLFAAKNSPEAHIYAIEPFHETFDILNKNIALNNFQSRIQTFPFALSDKDGYSPFYIGMDLLKHSLLTTASDKQDANLVETHSLTSFMDSLNITHIDMMKMNCEGSEYNILMTTSDTYLQRIKRIRLEYHTQKSGLSIDTLKDFLENKGFTCVRLKRYHIRHGIAWFERQ
jgi:FkbM family methyltransferase